MAKRITLPFGEQSVAFRQAVLRRLEDVEVKDFDEVLVTGIQPPRCGSERAHDPVNDLPPED